MKEGAGKTGVLEGSIFIADIIYIPVSVSYVYLHCTYVEIFTPL